MENAVRLATSLQAYKQKERQPYSTSNIDELLTKTGLREGSFDSSFPTMFSLHGLDIREALEEEYKAGNITENAKNYAIIGINNAMHELATREYPVLTEDTFKRVEQLLQEFIDIFYYTAPGNLDINKKRLMDKPFNELKALFKKPYVVVYYEGGPNRLASVKILHNSFANLRTIVNKKINSSVTKILKENKVTNSKLLDNNYLTSRIINWGHTAYGEKIISGKLIASLISLKGIGISNSEMNMIAKDFLEETGQEKESITIISGDYTKGNGDVLRLVLQSEFTQKVKIQGFTKNQIELGQQEKAWNLLKFLANARQSFTNKDAIAAILAERLLRVRSSPAPIEKIEILIRDAITGKKTKFSKAPVTLLNSTVSIKQKSKKVNVTKNTKSNIRKDNGVSILGRNTETSLNTLLNHINSSILEQIKRNMGTGTRTDVLNYRTGRFAESVKVEKLSESRQGMITAFYSYMKNPYSTFSVGGRQEFPRSRDPKSLISKSIREIAQTMVTNRLRAVAL